jgi:hypothetical protein
LTYNRGAGWEVGFRLVNVALVSTNGLDENRGFDIVVRGESVNFPQNAFLFLFELMTLLRTEIYDLVKKT